MNKPVSIVVLSVIIFAGITIAPIIKSNRQVNEIPVDGLPCDQSIGQKPKEFSIAVKARKLTTIFADSSSGLPNFFERAIEASVKGNAFRLDKVDPSALRKEVEMFDGELLRTIAIEKGKIIEESNQKVISPHNSVEFNIKNLGLVPVLNYLSDPATKIDFLGHTIRKENKIEVKVGASSFIVYSDAAHIIRRVEIGKYTIEYGDYRNLEGMQIPFIKRVFARGHLVYELIFTEIDLHPVFSDKHFSLTAL